MDYTDAIGHFGKRQRKLLAIISFRAICGAFGVFVYQLSSFDVGFWCNESAPDYFEQESECFLKTYDEITGKNATVQCNSWSYNKTEHQTIVEEWDLVCDRSWYVSFGYMAVILGNFLSYVPAGQLADKFGRHPLALYGQIATFITTLLSIFSNNEIWFLTFRFLMGVSYGFAQNSLLCIYLESVGPAYRDTIVFSFTGAWGVGIMMVAGVAYLVPNWRHMMLISVFCFMLPMAFLVWKFVGESTRWMLSVKKYDQAKIQMIKEAKQNGRVINNPDEIIEELKIKIEQDKRKSQPLFFDLFRNAYLRKRTLILYVVFILTVFIYHGFTITIGRLAGSLHANVALMGFMEIPTVFMYYVIVKFFDRRRGLLINFLVCGVLFLLALAIPDNLNWLKVTFSMIGRLCNSLAYTLLYIYVAELFPTNLRAVAMSGAMTAGRIGGVLAPLTDVLGRNYGLSVPNTIYGVMSLVTSLVFLLLPETRNKHLPDTVAQSERLAEDDQVTTSEIIGLDSKTPPGNAINS